jgi:hypothetical protein
MSQSNSELLLAVQLEQAGIPFEREYRFHDKRRWRFDFAFPYAMLAVEIDGGGFVSGRHSRGAGVEADAEKQSAAAILRWYLIRATPRQVDDGRCLQWIKDYMHISETEMTDRAVQPEAPTTEAGRALEREIGGDYAEEIAAIEAEARVWSDEHRRLAVEARAASQERPQPTSIDADWSDAVDRYMPGGAQERPPIDVLRSALERTLANFEAVLARRPVRDATETIAEARAALAGGSVASPERSE